MFRLEDGKYVANYKESMEILEYIFPKDKIIFIMCGAGGYANFTKQMLVSLGWDKSKMILLFVACMCLLTSCSGNKKIYLSNEFYSEGNFKEINNDSINQYNNKTYLLFTYNNYCSLPIPCDKIFLEVAKKNNISILSMPFSEFKKTVFYDTKVIKYLDANKDEDLEKYQDVDKFEKWLNENIYLKK